MIDEAVNFVAQRLDQYLKDQLSSKDDVVSVRGFTGANRQSLENPENRLLLIVTHIAPDSIAQDSLRRSLPQRSAVTGRDFAVQSDPIYLNISLMLVSDYHGDHYLQGLKALSRAIEYFHAHAVFKPQDTPDMPEAIEKLSLEISDQSAEAVSHLWKGSGQSYRPSIHYLMRGVTIDGCPARHDLPIQASVSKE